MKKKRKNMSVTAVKLRFSDSNEIRHGLMDEQVAFTGINALNKCNNHYRMVLKCFVNEIVFNFKKNRCSEYS